jgi:hypothetical protein
VARIRTIKPEFWVSLQVVECSPIARLLFIGIWNFVDDQGVMPRIPRTIKMQIFPGDDFDVATIDGWLVELETNGLLRRYLCEGREYIAVTGWHHQKIDRPTFKYPPPPPLETFDEHSTNDRRTIGDASLMEWNGMEWNGRESSSSSSPNPSKHSASPEEEEEEDKPVQNNGNAAEKNKLIRWLRSPEINLHAAKDVVNAAMKDGVTVREIAARAEFWLLHPGVWTIAQLGDSIRRSVPGEPPDQGWGTPDTTGKAYVQGKTRKEQRNGLSEPA